MYWKLSLNNADIEWRRHWLDRKISNPALEQSGIDGPSGPQLSGRTASPRSLDGMRRSAYTPGQSSWREQLSVPQPTSSTRTFALRPRQLRDQHVVVALLRDRQVAELELEVRVPEPVVQVFHVEELPCQEQAQLPAVHFFHLYAESRFSIRDLNSRSPPSSV